MNFNGFDVWGKNIVNLVEEFNNENDSHMGKISLTTKCRQSKWQEQYNRKPHYKSTNGRLNST